MIVVLGLTSLTAWIAGLGFTLLTATAPTYPAESEIECRYCTWSGSSCPFCPFAHSMGPGIVDDRPDPADVANRVVRADDKTVVIRRRNNSVVSRPTTGLESRVEFPVFRNAVLAGTSTPPSERETSAISKAADEGRAFVRGSTFNYWTGTRWIVWDARSNA